MVDPELEKVHKHIQNLDNPNEKKRESAAKELRSVELNRPDLSIQAWMSYLTAGVQVMQGRAVAILSKLFLSHPEVAVPLIFSLPVQLEDEALDAAVSELINQCLAGSYVQAIHSLLTGLAPPPPPHPAVIKRAGSELSRIAKETPDKLLPVLRARLQQDPPGDLKGRVFRIMGIIGKAHPQYIEADLSGIIQGVKDPNETVRKNAGKALDLIAEHPEVLLPHLLEHAQDVNASLKSYIKHAFTVMEQRHPEFLADALIAFIQGEDPNSAQTALKIVGRIGKKNPHTVRNTIPPMAKAISHDHDAVALEAFRSLEEMGKKHSAHLRGVMPLFISMLTHKGDRVRQRAAILLGTIGKEQMDEMKKAVPFLVKCLDDPDPSVVRHALSSLESINVKPKAYREAKEAISEAQRSITAAKKRNIAVSEAEGMIKEALVNLRELQIDDARRKAEDSAENVELTLERYRNQMQQTAAAAEQARMQAEEQARRAAEEEERRRIEEERRARELEESKRLAQAQADQAAQQAALTESAQAAAEPETRKLNLRWAFSYLFTTSRSKDAFKIIEDLHRHLPIMIMSLTSPTKLRDLYDIGNSTIFWLSENADADGAINPKRLQFEVTQNISAFTRDHPNGIMIIDGAEFLVFANGFDKTVDFLKGMTDLFSTSQNAFIVITNPSAYEERQFAIVSSSFDIVEDPIAFQGVDYPEGVGPVATPEPDVNDPATGDAGPDGDGSDDDDDFVIDGDDDDDFVIDGDDDDDFVID